VVGVLFKGTALLFVVMLLSIARIATIRNAILLKLTDHCLFLSCIIVILFNLLWRAIYVLSRPCALRYFLLRPWTSLIVAVFMVSGYILSSFSVWYVVLHWSGFFEGLLELLRSTSIVILRRRRNQVIF